MEANRNVVAPGAALDVYATLSAQNMAPRETGNQKPQRNTVPAAAIWLIGLGIVFMLNTLGILTWRVWAQTWKVWPLFLVAIGLQIVVAKRNRVLTAAIWVGLLAAALIVSYAFGGFRPTGDLVSANVSASLNGASSAAVRIESGLGILNVDGNEASQLASGTLGYYTGWGQPVTTTGKVGDRASLKISQPDDDFLNWGASTAPVWNIHLTPQVPMSLNIDGGAGESTLNLEKLMLTNLTLNAGVGNMTVIMPSNAGHTVASFEAGIGNLDLVIPAGVEARIRASSGIGNTNIDGRFVRNGGTYTSKGYNDAKNVLDVTIDAGVGNLSVSSR
jgi:hypothetical protein